MRKKSFISLALMLSVIMLAFTSIPAIASEVPADKYTYALSGEAGTQSKKIDLEEFDDNQRFRDVLAEEKYKIVLVKEGAEIKFSPKEKMPAVVSYYTVDGSYGGAMSWTIDGSEQSVSEIEANKTATVKLYKRYGGYTCDLYYVFSFGEDKNSNIIYIVSEGEETAASAPAEPAANPAEPTKEPAVKPLKTAIAAPSVSKVLVDGKQVSFEAYNINNNTYFKLRDIAKTVNGTAKSFEVGWDGEHNAISLTAGEAYTAQGGELAVSANPKAKNAALSTSKVYLDDQEAQLTSYVIGGNNYFKLRDIADALDITITFDSKTNTIGIETTAQDE
ncbi:copper amine oxidase-like protein [Fontibacillus phaseoli]|uniref:Copper amine oxidase-like protein n=1 Tax=Fontibacillus phaseoli TaxID=1416533 RepID=A0A369BQM9_9BACL|nr:stalk domain-containing protein [Fontibacillus phaseoli]RCX23701.1 copper amine oxidase-like protein [Fontibacillus phaseoli]